MKRILAIMCGGLLSISAALSAEPSQADQKWLTAVEQKVAHNDTKISTPSETRVNLLKQWAEKEGYSVVVTKSEGNFRVELSKSLAKK